MEGQTVARISVKDRLGPLPNDTASGRSKRRRGRNESVERNPRRGRKIPKNQQEGTDSPKKNTGAPRIPVHERLGVLPQQAFKKSDGQLFHKRNRQQVWRHEGHFQPELQTVAVQESKEMVPEVENKPPFVNPKPAPVHVKPFNAEQHRQTWTWVRPSTTSNSNSSSAAAMDIDESIENAN